MLPCYAIGSDARRARVPAPVIGEERPGPSSNDGHLVVGGSDVTELAERFGTPMLVFDRAAFEANARRYADALAPERIFYAAKAFLCVAVCELLSAAGMGIDVCSGGELSTALAADFPPERIIFHGNNKSADELALARDRGVGRIVADSFDELVLIDELAVSTKLLVRVTPGVEAHTHQYVMTGHADSKFGFALAGDIALRAVERALKSRRSALVGLHAHIGSQILDLEPFEVVAQRLAELASRCHNELGFEASELNLGGGLGVAYTSDEHAPEPRELVDRLTRAVVAAFSERGLRVPTLYLEPGRSVVATTMATVYRVGSVKRADGGPTWVAVDGGMSDNIRPALYGARYRAFLANRVGAPADGRAHIVGKHCESGDVLIRDAPLPQDVAPGDLLCVPATGAYTYSMASNYNRLPRPPVVMVHQGRAHEIVRRETIDEILSRDVHLHEALGVTAPTR
jgi:diaminopimelate decarboxylase